MLVARDRFRANTEFRDRQRPANQTLLTVSLKPVQDADAILVSDANPTCTAFCHAEGVSHKTVNLNLGQRSMGLIMCIIC